MGLWIFLLIILVIIIFGIFIRNKIVLHFNATKRAWDICRAPAHGLM